VNTMSILLAKPSTSKTLARSGAAQALAQTREFFNKRRNPARAAPSAIDKFAFDRIVELIPQGRANETALDLGCHWGRLSTWLARSFGRVVGVDFAEEALASAEQRENIEYIRLDLNSSASQLTKFAPVDLILAVAVFEMIECPELLCKQLGAIAKPGSTALVVIPNRSSVNYLSLRVVLWVSSHLLGRPRYIHNNGYSIDKLEHCLAEAGFKTKQKGAVIGLPLYAAGLFPPFMHPWMLKLDRFFLKVFGGSYHWISCHWEGNLER
jgi:2-polyprenyl-3-methyl-5-hydroxy-6-metoxy-1,4-benzoquinol methylase